MSTVFWGTQKIRDHYYKWMTLLKRFGVQDTHHQIKHAAVWRVRLCLPQRVALETWKNGFCGPSTQEGTPLALTGGLCSRSASKWKLLLPIPLVSSRDSIFLCLLQDSFRGSYVFTAWAPTRSTRSWYYRRTAPSHTSHWYVYSIHRTTDEFHILELVFLPLRINSVS